MVKRTITYKDYNDVERTEDLYFNLTETELVKLQYSEDGGLGEMIEKMIKSRNDKEIVRIFDRIIMLSYGEKTPDGRGFRKSEEISLNFSYTPAYDKLFMELAQNDKAMSDFINELIPSELSKKLAENKEAK